MASINNQQYLTAYNQLNEAQKEAVNALEGPVTVVAGPGTGKTQILALRVCNILLTQEVSRHNILCLTYTEAGTVAMRQRLIQFVGPEAYDIPIYTYHAFCNKIIGENAEYFGNYRSLQILSDLERVDVFQAIIDAFDDDHKLKRFKGNIYSDNNRLKNLFSSMKKEGWTVDWFVEQIEKFREEEPYREENKKQFFYSVNHKENKKGDKKLHGFKKHNDYCDILIAAAKEFSNYEKELHKRERFDYQDMIQWVVKAFKQFPDLKSDYQEQFQYILADEYQDTNGIQNELLMILADYWEKPNLFVVGDDDQSIFRFQGASMKNIVDFTHKYEPKMIVLKNNYRSSQHILDASMACIDHNVDRLVKTFDGLDKTLIASNQKVLNGPKAKALEFDNVYKEEAAILAAIKNWQQSGVALNECAVMYRKHNQIEDLVNVLTKENIPIKLKRRVNALDQSIVKSLLNTLHLIDAIYHGRNTIDEYLYPVMYLPVFGLSINTMHALALTLKNNQKTSWFSLIGNQAIVEEIVPDQAEKVNHFYEKLNHWVSTYNTQTIQVLIETILNDSGILKEALQANDNYFNLQLIQTFFDHFKEQTAAFPNMALHEHLDNIHKMMDNNIGLPLNQVIQNENGVLFTTLHSSKGLEFEKVWMLGNTKDKWEAKGANNKSFKIPHSIMEANEDLEDDERRLFYVGMTRAKSNLYLSYSKKKSEDATKELEPSKFLVELKESGTIDHQMVDIPEAEAATYLSKRLLSVEIPEKDWLDASRINMALESFKMNPTDLNKYLACPIRFYYENILRVPSARRESMGFGLAIHQALEFYLRQYQENKNVGLDLLIELFEAAMAKYKSHFTEKEYKNRMTFGKRNLSHYYEEYKETWNLPRQMMFEHKVTLANYQGVPVSGMIDRIDQYKDYIYVIDYKTGNADSGFLGKKLKKGNEEEEVIGGDYWRQMVFYKILTDHDPRLQHKMTSGEVNMLEQKKDGSFKKAKYVITPQEEALVSKQIAESYEKIMNHEFRDGCNEDTCHWCSFLKNQKA